MDLTFSAFTVQHLNLSSQASVVVIQSDGSTVSVQNPSVLYSRRDGRFTIKAANPVNTRTVNLRGATITTVEKGSGRTDRLVLL